MAKLAAFLFFPAFRNVFQNFSIENKFVNVSGQQKVFFFVAKNIVSKCLKIFNYLVVQKPGQIFELNFENRTELLCIADLFVKYIEKIMVAPIAQHAVVLLFEFVEQLEFPFNIFVYFVQF